MIQRRTLILLYMYAVSRVSSYCRLLSSEEDEDSIVRKRNLEKTEAIELKQLQQQLRAELDKWEAKTGRSDLKGTEAAAQQASAPGVPRIAIPMVCLARGQSICTEPEQPTAQAVIRGEGSKEETLMTLPFAMPRRGDLFGPRVFISSFH